MRSTELLEIKTFTSAGFDQNAYLLTCGGSGEAVVVDPGGASSAVAKALTDRALLLKAILLTHAHLDHIEGVEALVNQTGAPVLLHPEDTPLYEAAEHQAAWLGLAARRQPPVEQALEDGGEIVFGNCRLQVRHVPGHSPGHVLFHSVAAGAAFVGDLVFRGSIGRSDLPGGDLKQLMRSIRQHVLNMPDATVLYPGHGPQTTVGHERATNPFLVPQYGGGLA